MGILTSIAIALAVSGGVTQAVGAVKRGRAAGRAAEAEQEAAELNAQLFEAQAGDVLRRGAVEESTYRAGVRSLIGTQRAGFAGQGVVVTEGTAAELQTQTQRFGELDALQIRSNARLAAMGLRQRATIQRRLGRFAGFAAGEARAAGRLQAVGTFIGTGTNVLALQFGFGPGRELARG